MEDTALSSMSTDNNWRMFASDRKHLFNLNRCAEWFTHQDNSDKAIKVEESLLYAALSPTADKTNPTLVPSILFPKQSGKAGLIYRNVKIRMVYDGYTTCE